MTRSDYCIVIDPEQDLNAIRALFIEIAENPFIYPKRHGGGGPHKGQQVTRVDLDRRLAVIERVFIVTDDRDLLTEWLMQEPYIMGRSIKHGIKLGAGRQVKVLRP
jgi:hypothetical protein